MANAYLQAEFAVTRWKEGQRAEAIEMMKGVVEKGGGAATAYLLESLCGIADPQLTPVLEAIRETYPELPLDADAKRAQDGFRDPRVLREVKDQGFVEKQMGNQFFFVDEAIRKEKSGDHDGALAALRAVAARGGEAAGCYLVAQLVDLGDRAFVPLLTELAENRGDAWLGGKAREAIEVLEAPPG